MSIDREPHIHRDQVTHLRLERAVEHMMPGETIDRIVRESMEQLGMECGDESEAAPTMTSTGAIEFENASGLAFTKPHSASVNGKAIHNSSGTEYYEEEGF